MLDSESLLVSTLGPRSITSPLNLSTVTGDGLSDFVPDETRIRYAVEIPPVVPGTDDLSFEKAGPRERIFFDPANTTAAIVTCGGLCPGLNNVIRSMLFELFHNYGVQDVLGIRFGFQGLNPDVGAKPIPLTLGAVEEIHKQGGTILGSSRGPQDVNKMVDFLEQQGIDMLFCMGGEGTQRGAHAIHQAIARRGRKMSVIGIPKTIDNDIRYVTRSFGFGTALEKAREVIDGAHVEATGAPNCIGLVKLMGRDAGFIAAGATLASQQVNFCLIPEVPFPLDGEDGFLEHLKRRIDDRGHAVVVVAEGAGKHLMKESENIRDASGNVKHRDVGLYLRRRIKDYFASRDRKINLKYFDPSYSIRSVPANCDDSLLCDRLARDAVHAAMAGKTDTLIGLWNDHCIHVPITAVTDGKKQVKLEGDLWSAVIAATGQPRWI